MLLVVVLGVDPLIVHLIDIRLVLFVKIIHSSDHIVPLGREVLKLLVKGNFELPVLDFLRFQVLEIGLQVPDATTRGVVVSLEALQIIGLAQQI